MTLTMSVYAKNTLKRMEELRLKRYKDSAGIWTVGYGKAIPNGQPEVCTVAQAESWLGERIEFLEQFILKTVKVPLTQCQFDALIIFVYNIGISAFFHSTMLRLLNLKQYALASNEFTRWTKAGKPPVEVKGLRNRRLEEQSMFRGEVSWKLAGHVANGVASLRRMLLRHVESRRSA